LLCFEEAFNEENAAYENVKVCELRGMCFVMFLFWFFFSSFMFSFCMQVFVEEDNVDFGVGEVGVVFDGAAHVVFDGVVGVVFNGVVGVAFDGVVGVYVHHGVCDSFVGVTYGNPFFNILTRVLS
jgi:hypothetical protein